MRHERVGLLYVLCAVTGYAFLPIFAAGLRASGLPPVETVLWRYLFTLPLFVLLSLRSAPSPLNSKPLPRVGLFLLGFGLAIEGISAFVGLRYIPAGIYLVLYYTYPAITALYSTLLGEKMDMWAWFALVLTLIGVMLTIADFDLGTNPDALLGVAMALLNASLAGVYYIAMARMLKGHSSTIRAGTYMVSGTLVFMTVVTFGIAAANHTAIPVPQGMNGWANLIGLVLISTFMPLVMMNKGIKAAGATRSAIFGTIEPLMTAVLAMFLLGEQMKPIQWVGGLIVVSSVILLQLRGTPEPAADAVPASANASTLEPT